MSNIKELEEKIGIAFSNKLLLQEALTHRSYLNEHPDWETQHNERLEFLGDAVLELVSTEFLFNKFPSAPEGELTGIRSALVNYRMLANVGDSIGLGSFVLLSRGEAKGSDKAREAIFANTVEALIGAIYLDLGYKAAKKFIEKFLFVHLDKILKDGLYRDPKGRLQEVVQEKMKLTPSYAVLSLSGPDHDKEFVVGVFFGEELAGKGTGASKQEAEVAAAESALKELTSNG